jgi:hypothetical protein
MMTNQEASAPTEKAKKKATKKAKKKVKMHAMTKITQR